MTGTRSWLVKLRLHENYSDFIEEINGFVTNESETARECLEVGQSRDGYWNSNKFMKHVGRAVSIFESKYPKAQAEFILDQSPCHKCSQKML